LNRPSGPHREEALMALVICDMSSSLDGYVTGPNDSRENPFGDGAGMLHDWIWDAATDDDRAILKEAIDNAGAIVMGRKSFDKNEGDGGWGDGGPMGDVPCFVVTHTKPTGSYPSVYTFVTDGVASAIVMLGAGTPLFGTLDSAITLERTNVRVTPAATHLRFRVLR
jgi:dihydrofolate reductase